MVPAQYSTHHSLLQGKALSTNMEVPLENVRYKRSYVESAVCFHQITNQCIGHVGLVVRTADSQSKEHRFESICCHFKAWAILYTPQFTQQQHK